MGEKRGLEDINFMKPKICERCGGVEFKDVDGYSICQYCNTKYLLTPEDLPMKASTIALQDDIRLLLQKCKDDPANARRYASLVLDIDPSNSEAKRYFYQ
jgi:uncharacterized Zn finger protein (UPF0148 family)